MRYELRFIHNDYAPTVIVGWPDSRLPSMQNLDLEMACYNRARRLAGEPEAWKALVLDTTELNSVARLAAAIVWCQL